MTSDHGVVVARAALLLSFWTLAAGPSEAAPFEVRFGRAEAAEGASNIIPVQACGATGGWLAVGWSMEEALDIHVVRVAPDGSSLWERTYDFSTSAGTVVRGVVESRNGSGFVLAGGVGAWEDQRAPFLLKIDCSGGFVWARRYWGPSEGTAVAIIEAQGGDAARGTAAGDLLVAINSGHDLFFPDREPILVRTNAYGTPIWSRNYRGVAPAAWSYFAGLAEVEAAARGPRDVVAVGARRSSPDPQLATWQAFAVRVSGDDGERHTSNHCIAAYGQASVDTTRLTSITPRLSPDLGEELLLTGVADDADLYLLRTGASPCDLRAAGRIADVGGASLHSPRTPRAPVIGSRLPGRLAIAGGRNGAAHDDDLFLLFADAVTLAPASAVAFRYGTETLGEYPGGLASAADGFALAGDYPAAPLSDAYIVRTDSAGRTGCERTFDVQAEPVVPRVTALAVPIEAARYGAGPTAGWLYARVTGAAACPR